MQLGGNGYVSVAKMTELFDAMGMYQDACAEISESSDMDLDDDDAL
jgi:hypothetical protein